MFDIENIFCTTLKGDKLAKFLQDWDTVLAGQGETVPESILKPLLHRQLLLSPSLKEEMAHYERALPGSADKTYAYLYRVLCRRVELNRQDSNRKALLSHHAGGGNAPAMAAEQKNNKGRKKKDGNGSQNRKSTPRANGRGKGDDAPSGVCFSFWRTGACSTQGCKWEHRANPNKIKGGKSGRRNPSTDSKGNTLKPPRLQ